MKTGILMLLPMVALTMVSCELPMDEVPPNTRKVVGPPGSSENVKPWNETTKQEGDATLGPLSDMNRR